MENRLFTYKVKTPVKNIQPGQTFTLTTRINAKKYTVGNNERCIDFLVGDRIPIDCRGKLLLVFNNCRQMVINPETEVYIL